MILKKLGNGSLLLLPGMMGSELWLDGRGSNGVLREQLVWGEDFGTVWQTLACNPELLASRDLVATGVIRTVRLGRFKARDVYGPLMDYCVSGSGLGLRENSSFYVFPYDWRQDLTRVAVDLGAAIKRLPAPVFVVAHSMGGLIARIMLNLDPIAEARVRGVFQIACPVSGSIKAYTTLKQRPSLGPIGDPLWKIFHIMGPQKRARLMDALGNMPSLYQMLPPADERVLLQNGGKQRSALDEEGWARRDLCMLAAATRAHRYLAATPRVPIKCVYATQLPTAWLLAVDDNWSFVACKMRADGDGTVTTASASARSSDILAVGGREGEHTRLCSRADVHDALRRFLS